MTSSFRDLLASLLPQDVKFAAGGIRDAPRDMFASEELAISSAVERRRHEFSAGRSYARLALAACGCTPQPIPVGADRRPVWPKGYVGSISHSDRLCAAVASRADRYAGLGIDTESDASLPADLRDMVCRPEERFGRVPPGCDLAKMLFVAKEAVFKAYYPVTEVFLDFHDVAVKLIPASCSFEAVLVRRQIPQLSNRPLLGRIGTADSHVVAVVAIARADLAEIGS